MLMSSRSQNSQVRSILLRMLRIIEFKSRSESTSTTSIHDDDDGIISRTGSYYSVGSELSQMLENSDGQAHHNFHVLPQDSELNAIFGIFPVNQNIERALQEGHTTLPLQERIKRVLAQRNLGGWLFNFTRTHNNDVSLNHIPQLDSSEKRFIFASIIAKSWTSLAVTSDMTAEYISRISARGANIISHELNPNFEIYVSEHCIGRRMEY